MNDKITNRIKCSTNFGFRIKFGVFLHFLDQLETAYLLLNRISVLDCKQGELDHLSGKVKGQLIASAIIVHRNVMLVKLLKILLQTEIF